MTGATRSELMATFAEGAGGFTPGAISAKEGNGWNNTANLFTCSASYANQVLASCIL